MVSLNNYDLCKSIAIDYVNCYKDTKIDILSPKYGNIGELAFQHAEKMALGQQGGQSYQNLGTIEDRIPRIFMGEIAEQAIFITLKEILKKYGENLSHNKTEELPNVADRIYWLDMSSENLNFEIKTTRPGRTFIDWKDSSMIKILIDNADKIDLIFLCKVDTKDYCVYPYAIIYGPKFNEYLYDSEHEFSIIDGKKVLGKFMYHDRAEKDGFLWFINKGIMTKKKIDLVFDSSDLNFNP